MATRPQHLHIVKFTLKDGTVREYRYHRKTRRKIHSPLGSRGFSMEFERAAGDQRGAKKSPVPKAKRSSAKGFVYFIEAGTLGLVKIGWASNVDRRLRSMQSGSPVRLRLLAAVATSWTTEGKLHGRLAHLREHGEWFRRTAELDAVIAEFGSPPSASACPPQGLPR